MVALSLQGVDELHARGCCHGDLKLDNIRVKSGPGPLDFWVIIIDFGGGVRIGRGMLLMCVSHELLHTSHPTQAYKQELMHSSRCDGVSNM